MSSLIWSWIQVTKGSGSSARTVAPIPKTQCWHSARPVVVKVRRRQPGLLALKMLGEGLGHPGDVPMYGAQSGPGMQVFVDLVSGKAFTRDQVDDRNSSCRNVLW